MDRRESAEIAQLLSIGFLADRTLIALDLYQLDQLPDEEQELLARLEDLFDAIVQLGERPATILTRESPGFAFPAAQYVALELVAEFDAQTMQTVVTTTARMRDTLRAIRDGESVGSDDVLALIDFLERLAESSLGQVDTRQLRLEAGSPDRRKLAAEWQKISAP